MENEYDVKKVTEEIEQDLIIRMKRTLWSHKQDEEAKGFKWSQWQTLKLKQLEDYRKENKELFKGFDKQISIWTKLSMRKQFREGASKTNKEALKAGVIRKEDSQLGGSFFGLNHRKLDALIKSTKEDMNDVKYATLRMANDQYRQIVFKAQVYANTGAGTVKQAIDMATHDFLAKGFNCIEYKDDSRHNIADYCDMAIRTANKRANLMGEGEMRKKLGNPLVYISKHNTSCDKCGKWQGRVYIDDVWSGGKAEDGEYPLLSTAIAGGLFHPRCRHGSSTYYEGINEEPDEVTEAKNDHKANNEYIQALQRQKKQYERLALGSLLPENIEKYQKKANELQNQIESKYIDVTNQFNVTKDYQVKEQDYFIDEGGNRYVVDGKNVIMKHTDKEKEVARLLGEIYGGEVKLIPAVLNPQGIKTPDYMINNIKFDLKEPTGNSITTIYNLFKNKKKQANNFIIDIHKSGLSREESIRQTREIFNSKHRDWIDTIILMQDNKVLKVYKRK